MRLLSFFSKLTNILLFAVLGLLLNLWLPVQVTAQTAKYVKHAATKLVDTSTSLNNSLPASVEIPIGDNATPLVAQTYAPNATTAPDASPLLYIYNLRMGWYRINDGNDECSFSGENPDPRYSLELTGSTFGFKGVISVGDDKPCGWQRLDGDGRYLLLPSNSFSTFQLSQAVPKLNISSWEEDGCGGDLSYDADCISNNDDHPGGTFVDLFQEASDLTLGYHFKDITWFSDDGNARYGLTLEWEVMEGTKIATFYSDANLTGRKQDFGIGKYNVNALYTGVGNDNVSSMDIGPDYKVLAYNNANFEGIPIELTGTVNFVGDDINDKISSFEIVRNVQPCVFTPSDITVSGTGGDADGVYVSAGKQDGAFKWAKGDFIIVRRNNVWEVQFGPAGGGSDGVVSQNSGGSIDNIPCSGWSNNVTLSGGCGSLAPNFAPSVTITASPSGSITAGTNVTFTANPTRGGNAPIYQWSKNGNPVGSGGSQYSDNNLFNGDIVQVTMTSNDACASPTTATSRGTMITVNPACTAPATYNVTGGGTYCAGTAGLPVGLSNSEVGVSYQLKNSSTNVGEPVAGTGQALNFGNQTAGTYTVAATRNGCSATMNGNATLGFNTISVTNSTNPPCNGTGSITFATSVPVGIYSLSYKRGGSTQTASVQVVQTGSSTATMSSSTAGSNAFTLSGITVGSYTDFVISYGGCEVKYNGPVSLDPPNSPAAFALTGGGNICPNASSGLSIGLAGSQTGVSYQLRNGNNNVGYSVPGTGLSLNFGTFSTAGTYTVVATNANGCTSTMTGSATVSIILPVSAQASANSALICSNQTLRLTATPNQAGLTYNWKGPADFTSTLQNPTRTGLTTAMSGVYSVTINRSACNASGSATVSVVVSPSGAAFAPQMTALTFNNTAPNAQTNTVGVCAGSALTLNITANQHTLTYNWRGPAGAGSGSGFLSAPVNGVTNASAQISAAVAANQQGQYTVTVRNGCNVSNHRVINLQVRNCNSTRLASAEGEGTLGLAINLAPNPVRDYLTASLEGVEGQTVQVQLIDDQGRNRQQATIEAAEGKAQHRFDLRSLPAGMYLLQAETETQRAVKKVIKL
jgi:hypothetical protein